jgi:hypothetical protein
MKKLFLAAMCGAALGLTGCGGGDEANNAAAMNAEDLNMDMNADVNMDMNADMNADMNMDMNAADNAADTDGNDAAETNNSY